MDKQWRNDIGLAAAFLALEFGWAMLVPEQRSLDGIGALLLIAGAVPLAFRRFAPLAALLAHAVVVLPYHAQEYPHEAVVPSTMVLLYAVARYGNRRRTALVMLGIVTVAVLGIVLSSMGGENSLVQALGATGWIVVACIAGEAVRLQHAYLAEAVDRAERAERSRDEEARRQVAEERLRIARDLHDLLAHTITVIQVQSGVAAHLLTERHAEPDTVVAALDTISAACVDARAELAATVGVLRADGPESRGPLPSLAQVPALAEHAEAAGSTVEFVSTGPSRPLAPTVEMVGYRIVQEALTNVAKHSSATRVEVRLDYHADRLTVRIADNGHAPSGDSRESATPATGFGVRGMTERAAAIGGTLTATAGAAGFTVIAELPVAASADMRRATAVDRAPVADGAGFVDGEEPADRAEPAGDEHAASRSNGAQHRTSADENAGAAS